VMLSGDSEPLGASAICLCVSLLSFVAMCVISFFAERSEINNFYSSSSAAQASSVTVGLIVGLGARNLMRYVIIHVTSSLTSTIVYAVAIVLAQLYIAIFEEIAWTWYAVVGLACLPPALGLHVWYMGERQKRMASVSQPLTEQQPLASKA